MSVQEKSLKNQIADVQSNLNTVDSQVQLQLTSVESTVQSHYQDIQTNVTAINQIGANVASNITRLASVENTLTNVEPIITDNVNRLDVVESSLSSEITRATSAEAGLINDVNLINTRLGFCQTMEYDGVLSTTNSYPFCMGAGVPSSSKFGFFIHKPFKLTGYSFHVESESTDINVALKIEGREYDPITKTIQGPNPTWIADASVGNTKFNVDYYMDAVEHIEGVVSVRVDSTAGVGNQSDRYRLTLFFEYF